MSTDHGNTRERRDTLGGEGAANTTDKSLPHSDYLTVREQMIDEHAAAPPAKIVLTDKDYRPRTGREIPGSPEWMKTREAEANENDSTTAP